jgi:hypothetical protein
LRLLYPVIEVTTASALLTRPVEINHRKDSGIILQMSYDK